MKWEFPNDSDKTLLQMEYARIITLLSQKMNISETKTMELFYNSYTNYFMSNGISDFHCLRDAYLTKEIILEQKEHQN